MTYKWNDDIGYQALYELAEFCDSSINIITYEVDYDLICNFYDEISQVYMNEYDKWLDI